MMNLTMAVTVATALLGARLGALHGPLEGSLLYYGDGVMERVYQRRLGWGHVAPCAECVGMAALLERKHLGKRVWLQRPGRAAEGPFLVVDCAAQGDLRRLQARGVVGEVDRQTARRWRMNGPLRDVRVLFEPPEEGDDGHEGVFEEVPAFQ